MRPLQRGSGNAARGNSQDDDAEVIARYLGGLQGKWFLEDDAYIMGRTNRSRSKPPAVIDVGPGRPTYG